MELIKTKTYKLFYGSCNISGTVKPSKLAEIFSELADEQVDDLIAEYPFLYDKDRRWILVRYHVEFIRQILAEETFEISTYQAKYSKFTCIRDYVVKDANGNVIVLASCQWVMKDITTAKICSVPKEYSNLTANYKEENECEPEKLDDFTCDAEFDLPLRYDDFDYNHHVNNTKYFSFIINFCLGFDISQYSPILIDINYKQGMTIENHYKQGIKKEVHNNKITVWHKFYNENDIAAIAKSVWIDNGEKN